MSEFTKIVYTPATARDVTLAIAACRAGGVGVVNAELDTDGQAILAQLDVLAAKTSGGFGLKIGALDDALISGIRSHVQKGLRWLILDDVLVPGAKKLIADLRKEGVKVLAEIRTLTWSDKPLEALVDGLMLKGNEAGGFVGESASFIMLQRWLKQTKLPLYIHGGLTPNVAAACQAAGIAGGVLDSQMLLLDEVRLPESVRAQIATLSGSETVAVGNGETSEYFRILVRPGHNVARALVNEAEGKGYAELRKMVEGRINWKEPKNGLLPVGHDICFAAAWHKAYRNVAGVFAAIDAAIANNLRIAVEARTIYKDSLLAKALGTEVPVLQGPMTRVSDSAQFAKDVAEGGALPMVAFALLKGEPLMKLLQDTTRLLGSKPWGIGLLGFAPQSLLDEQLNAATQFKPSYAIIAGGRPDQAVKLEASGIPSFLHVPAANLIPMFLQEGARRFIFEGRECGGHIGPLSSFVLWSTMVDRLLVELGDDKVPGSEVQLIFAGGIHDAVSSAMVQVLVAPLVAKGCKIGILMGSAYLFTKEIVSSGAIVPMFQKEVIDCEQTSNLESGPGHASRCGYTPFAKDFFAKRKELREKNVAGDEARQVLDDLIMGRLRIASKGTNRIGAEGKLVKLDEKQQHAEGMYMLGQVATLRDQVTTVAALHQEVTEGASAFLSDKLAAVQQPEAIKAEPVDIAVIGMASILPKANTTDEYWENILKRVDAITEIPSHRWDWRLYFDEDRKSKDKIYSRWGGFLDDMVFDPTKYGMPPNAIKAVDPMQLMALEVANRTLVDAGYKDRAFDRNRASVIIGASGGAGDVGMQYGLRSELPRFNGTLPDQIADRLPEWTEDTFAGILINVVAGRIANRLNFGGVNFTTDAACASSLTAIYQGVSELVAGRSDLVIAGGVDTVQGPFGYLCFSKTQALSPRGRCSSFDAAGDGIAIAEGLAMVALKRLSDAERDGDRIYAVIKGAGGSSDGNAKGMTAPLPAGQLRAMRRAYAQAGFGPSAVGLFEAHGTGTVAGDTAELESTTLLLKESGALPHSAVIGSVKTNIGHTKAAAGVAGLVKAALALHHKVLPPHRNVTVPNAVLQKADSPLYLLDEAMPWIVDDQNPRRAAVSAFGFGGTNFHIVLEEYTREYREWLRPAPARTWPAELLLWSESDRKSLADRLVEMQQSLTSMAQISLQDLAASLAKEWSAGGESLAIVAKDMMDLTIKMAKAVAWLRGEADALPPGIYHGAGKTEGRLAVLFSGQGSQYPRMLREAALYVPAISEVLSQADTALKDNFAKRFGEGRNLSHFIFPRGAYSEEAKTASKQTLTSTDIAQPALGAVEAGLWQWMTGMGLKADMLAGHSYGEFAALYAAGAIDFNSLMTLSAARGASIIDAAKSSGAELGTMAAINARREDVEKAISKIEGVIVANHNAPMQSIISGSKAGVQAAMAELTKAGIEVTEIPVAAAFHSEFVKPAQKALADVINGIEWKECSIPVYSNTTAKPHAADLKKTKKLMAEHLVKPVEFVAEVEAMYADGARIFLEIGPKSVLSRLTSKILEGKPHLAIAADDGSGLGGTLAALAQLLCAGVDLDVMRLFDGRDCRIASTADLQALQRVEVVPKTAWMLNGAGARRFNEPVRQIGIRLEDVATQAAIVDTVSVSPVQHEPVSKAAPAPAPARAAAEVVSRPRTAYSTQFVPATQRKKEQPMEQRRSAPIAGDPAVMAEYFDVMRQFLETQERVIGRYFGDSIPVAGRVAARMPRQALSIPSPDAEYAPQPRVAALPRQAAAPVLPAKPAAEPAPRPAAPAKPVAAAPAAAPAPRPAVATKPAPAAAPAPAAEAAKPKTNGAEAPQVLDKEKMTDMLLSIVEEKTGYPRDMVGLNQNLESDLGIDSIKRIEVVGAMLQRLPESYREQLTPNRSKLNTQSTLNGILGMLTAVKVNGAATGPFDQAGTGEQAVAVAPGSHSPRHIVVAQQEAVDRAIRKLTTGHFLIGEDRLGVAAELSKLLTGRGCTVTLIPREVLAKESALTEWCAKQAASIESIAGIVHLVQLGADWMAADASLDEWRLQIQVNEKSLFTLLHELGGKLVDGAHAMSASGLGGFFNRHGSVAKGLSLQSGAVGLLKSLHEERPEIRCKAVDVDPSQSASNIAETLLDELELVGGRIEVGYPQGRRTVFHTVEASVDVHQARGEGIPAFQKECLSIEARQAQQERLKDVVVLATGGARGITAEVLRELAMPGNTLILTARSPLPEAESAEVAALTSADDLRKYFIGEIRAGRSQIKLADVGKKVASVLGARELLANIADFKAAGATVEYHAVDAANDADMRRLIEDLYERFGRIDGVVHGAGIIEDKLIVDKTSDSWSRVVETKILGLALLQKYIRPDSLRFFTVFSSVAGRYGNSGQSDYSTANELMNRLCCQLGERWGGKVNVSALCWGPWGPTKFGAGMVTADTEAKFAEKGVLLVTAETGRKLFHDEIARSDFSHVEIVCGAGPWEFHEANIGAIQLQEGAEIPAAASLVTPESAAAEAPAPVSGDVLSPLLGAAVVTAMPKGDQVVSVTIDSRHPFLQEHKIDGTPVLPAAGAMEMISQAARALWKGWKVVEVRDFRLMKGVEFKEPIRHLSVIISPPPYGSSEGFEVNAVLQSELESGRSVIHYKCVLRFEQQLPEGGRHERRKYNGKRLTVEKAYDEWLFHGPCFQVIEKIEGMSEEGAMSAVHISSPQQWVPTLAQPQDRWVFEPALIDAAAQMALLWARMYRDESCLPAKFGRVVRHREVFPEKMFMDFECAVSQDPSYVRAHVYFCDKDGSVVMAIEDMECIASAALNRLGGTFKPVSSAVSK